MAIYDLEEKDYRVSDARFAVVAARFNNSSVLIFLIVCYIALGLAEELRFLHQRRVAARAERARAGEQVSDAVVLAELGVEK